MGSYGRAESCYRHALSTDPYAERANVSLARVQVLRHRVNPAAAEKADIVKRLSFVLSVNPNNTQAEKLLREIEQADG